MLGSANLDPGKGYYTYFGFYIEDGKGLGFLLQGLAVQVHFDRVQVFRV